MKNKSDFDLELERLKRDRGFKQNFQLADRALDISIQIYSLRKKMGYSQKRLAELTGVSQSNIARLEKSDYTGYTLKTLDNIASALRCELSIQLNSLSSTITQLYFANNSTHDQLLSFAKTDNVLDSRIINFGFGGDNVTEGHFSFA